MFSTVLLLLMHFKSCRNQWGPLLGNCSRTVPHTGTALNSRWPITAVLSDESVMKQQYCYLDLSSDNWLTLEDLSKVLEPLEVATVFISRETNVSQSTVLPVVYGLLSKLAATEDDIQNICEVKIKIVAALRRS